MTTLFLHKTFYPVSFTY